VVSKLELENVSFYHGRAEDFAKPGQLRESFDFAVSRAVANLSSLSELCIPYVKEKGYFISYKGDKASEELQQAENAISILGGKLEDCITFHLPNSDIERNLLVIKKEKATPKKYPRKAGTPTKQPL
jgi:16S rRNA (guanine527-N7)-methyltransferase